MYLVAGLSLLYLLSAISEGLFALIIYFTGPKKRANLYFALSIFALVIWTLTYYFFVNIRNERIDSWLIGTGFVCISLTPILGAIGFRGLVEKNKKDFWLFLGPLAITLAVIFFPFWHIVKRTPVWIVQFNFSEFYPLALLLLAELSFASWVCYKAYGKVTNPSLKRKMKLVAVGFGLGGAATWALEVFLGHKWGLPPLSALGCFVGILVVSPAFIAEIYREKGLKKAKVRRGLQSFAFLTVRIVGALTASFAWIYLYSPNNLVKGQLYMLLSFFVTYSLVFYFLTSYLPHLFKRLYLFMLIPDIVFVAKVIGLTGGATSPFFLVYCLLAALYASYYNLPVGLEAVGLMAASDTYNLYISYQRTGVFNLRELLMHALFLTTIAVVSGLVSRRWQIEKRQIELLHETGREIASIFNQEDLIRILDDKLGRLFEINTYCLVLLDRDTGKVKAASSTGLSQETSEGIARQIEKKARLWLAKPHRHLADVKEKEALEDQFAGIFGYTPLEEHLHITTKTNAPSEPTSFICLPLVSKDRLVGSLSLEEETVSMLTKDDLDALSTITSQIIMALENVKLYERAQELADHDGLTGLFNYRYFYERLEFEVERAKRYNHSLAVLMIDLDSFKDYNDYYGHPAGDKALREVAKIITKYCRQVDIVARYGGEEFVVILPETEKEAALEVAERIRRATDRDFLFSNKLKRKQHIHLTLSVGVAACSPGVTTAGDLINNADAALYDSKRKGKNIVSAA